MDRSVKQKATQQKGSQSGQMATGAILRRRTKMKVKEISVEIKRSYAYQTICVGKTITIEEGDNATEATKAALNECTAHCLSEIAKIKGEKK